MGESVYEKQKAPVAKSNDGVGGFANLKTCSKCGVVARQIRKCEHCNEELCQGCFYEEAHHTEYRLAYGRE